jgi:hypothetical protein
MESSKKFVQNRTIFLKFDASGLATADINIPFAVDRVIFRSLAYKEAAGPNPAYAVLDSDLIQWNSIGVVYRDDTYANSAAQYNEYHFQTPTKIQGRFNFQLYDLTVPRAEPAGITDDVCVFIAEFIRDKDGKNEHAH